MIRPLHLRRSWLFVGATNEDDIHASLSSDADVCILEFEDFCLPSNRPKGRKMLPEILKAWNKLGKVAGVRINPLESKDGLKDLQAAICKDLNIILLPKVEKKKQVETFVKEKNKHELKNNIKKNTIEFFPNIESSLGMENLKDILNSRNVKGALVASEDMALSLDLLDVKKNEMLDFIRKRFHLACKAYGKLTIDMPNTWGNVNDLKKELIHIKKLGILAKSTVKASHCKIINTFLTPTKLEVANSINIITRFKKALNENKSQILYKEHYLELPVFEKANRLLARYKSFIEYDKKIIKLKKNM